MKNPLKINQFINIIANPFVLAIPVSIFIIFLFLPNTNSKYKVTLAHQESADKKHCSTQFFDLDKDGNDERIISFHNIAKGKAAIKVLTSDGNTFEQWNMNGQYKYNNSSTSCFDLNKDGLGEIYSIYYRADSVFLSVIQPYPHKQWIIKEKFITTIWKRNGEIDYTSTFCQAYDIDNDGIDELIFRINAGFSQQPRSLFIFYYHEQKIEHSPSYGAYLVTPLITDLDKDGAVEFYLSTSTPNNIPDTMGIPYSDYSSWMMAFDSKLHLKFEPKEIKGKSGFIPLFEIDRENDSNLLLANYWQSDKKEDHVILFNQNGEVVKSFLPINSLTHNLLNTTFRIDDQLLYFIGSDESDFIFLNQDLELQRIAKPIKEKQYLYFVDDLNKDGRMEYIFSTNDYNYIIYDQHLKNPVKLKTGIQPFDNTFVYSGIKHNKNIHHQFFYKTDRYLYLYNYEADPNYYFKYFYWILAYILIAVLFWIAQYAQRIRTRKKQKIEETINTLQMKTLKSQMDPHFMFNVLNGIASKVRKGDKIESYDHIVRFSHLLRSLMKKVDKLEVSLEEELKFIKTYLELEKFRFDENFDFKIDIEDQADLNTKIPRMLIQLLVENAIKHGLSPKPDLKAIHISVHKLTDRIEVKIKDNGIGRQAAQEKTTDSGQGLKIIDQMIGLYKKTTGNRIELHYQDLKGEDGAALGTLVVVSLF